MGQAILIDFEQFRDRMFEYLFNYPGEGRAGEKKDTLVRILMDCRVTESMLYGFDMVVLDERD